MNHTARAAAVAIVALLAWRNAGAQEMHGVVSDSVTARPLGGAVVVLLDSTGESLARTITDERGAYRLTSSPRARTLRTIRIGFRPRTVPVAAQTAIDVGMAPIPPMLDRVDIQAAGNCPRRDDRLAALSLLQQARAGLLATIVARETNPATMVRLAYERSMDGTSDRIRHQRVRVDSSGEIKQSFTAVRTGADFVKSGFVANASTSATFLAPDAETLIDDGFAAGYCFRVADRDRKRPTEVGLSFEPASRRRERIDIEGTLWIDTVARSLRNIEFKYLGLDRDMKDVHAGGDIYFREMKNGVVFIDRWSLRIPEPHADTTISSRGTDVVHPWFGTHESGGEVATASWHDGTAWKASLGTLRAQALDYRQNLARGVVVRLYDTDYIASPSARGILEIPNLLPGPYEGTVIDSLLGRLGIAIPVALHFTADRDSLTQMSFTVPRTEDDVRAGCIFPGAIDSLPMVGVNVTTPDGRPVEQANIRIVRDYGVDWMVMTETRRTDGAGNFTSCLRYQPGDKFDVYVWRDGETPRVHFARVDGRKVNVVKLELPQVP